MGIFSRFSDYFLRINSQEQNCWFEGYAHLASWWWLFVSFYIPISSREESLFPHIFASTDFKSLPVQSLTFFLKKKKGNSSHGHFLFLFVVEVSITSIFLKGRIEINLRIHFFFQATTIPCTLRQALSSCRWGDGVTGPPRTQRLAWLCGWRIETPSSVICPNPKMPWLKIWD